MSRQGMKVALQYALELPSFSDQAEAQKTLFAWKDKVLASFIEFVPEAVGLDYSPDSLKRIERWYFQEPRTSDVSEKEIELGLGFYFGEMFCRNAGFSWIVNPYFLDKSRYEIGVTHGFMSVMLTRGRKPMTIGNKRMQSLFREFKQWARS